MAKKFVNELRVGDVIMVEDGILQAIKTIHPGSKNTTAIEFENGKLMITGHTAQYPVVSCKVDVSMSIEEVYNSVLDDNMSLTEFTVWCSKKRQVDIMNILLYTALAIIALLAGWHIGDYANIALFELITQTNYNG